MKQNTGRTAPKRGVTWLLCALLTAAAVGCNRGRSNSAQNAPRPPVSDFEAKLGYVRRAGQSVRIYVVRRKDGGPLQPDDKAFLRAFKPMQTGMWVLTDDQRVAIAGANFEFEPGELDTLVKRFDVEDYTRK